MIYALVFIVAGMLYALGFWEGLQWERMVGRNTRDRIYARLLARNPEIAHLALGLPDELPDRDEP